MSPPVRAALDRYYHEVASIILTRQNAVTGLIPASVAITTHGDYRDAWVRDNVYTIFSVWGLALAYRRIDDDDGRGYELEHATIKTMRGLLFAMMRQADKVEKFKNTQAVTNALHAKYNTQTGGTVVGDNEWGHLQIDATSIFLLMLSQMTASGMRVVYTMDEVHFIQNLVFYIERAYRTPDFGVWERGNKVNHGEPELNSSSIGMVVAALQAIKGLNLFGARGGPASVIHVLPDEITRNYTTLHSALPRESGSKEIDAALLSVISFPAFAVHDEQLVTRTRNEIVKKLGGNYGFKRFLRDGHQTMLEDHRRLHYDPAELKIFEGIESEWPLFYTYMILDGLFRDDPAQVHEYRAKLDPLLVDSEGIPTFNRHQLAHEPVNSPHARTPSVSKRILPPAHMRLVPELFIVPRQAVEAERKSPKSQERVPNENVPLVWAQSLYILGNLIHDELLSPAELDPLGRRLSMRRKSNSEVVVQVVILSEDEELQDRLRKFGLDTQVAETCAPVKISPPSALRDAYTALGENQKLGLTGRPKRPMGTLSTCKLYRCQGKLYAFTPHFMDKEEFYLVSDNDYLVSLFEQELSFVRNHWDATGRPTMTVMLTREMMAGIRDIDQQSQRWRHDSVHSSGRNLLNFMMSLRSGRVGGVRVRSGRLSDMIPTACVESLDFLVSVENSDYEDWDSVLSGQGADHDLSKLSYSPIDTEEAGKERMRSASGEYRRTRRRSSMDLLAPKSPLASPWVMDEVWTRDGFRLHDHIEETDETVHASHSVRVETPRHGPMYATCDPIDPNSSPPKDSVASQAVLTLTLRDAGKVPAAVDLLRKSSNLFDQIDLLHYIYSCHGLGYDISGLGTVSTLLEEVYLKAMHLRQWSIVRQAAGLLKKMVNSLTINLSDLLIRQRPVTIGYGSEEMFITSPMSPAALKESIYKHCASDVREAPLVQEILTYLGSFIRGTPDMFEGIMRVRTHFFIIAIREEISRLKGCNEEVAIEQLMQLSPYEMCGLLGQILAAHDTCNLQDLHHSATLGLTASIPRVRHLANVQVEGTESSAMRLSNIGANLPTDLLIQVQSAGFNAGNFARIDVWRDGQKQQIRDWGFGRGLNVALLDPLDGTILERVTFDTHVSQNESEEFAKLVEFLDPGTIVVVAVMDDAAENLSELAVAALESLGSASIRSLQYRDSWCIIGERGAEKGSVPEHYMQSERGPTPVLEQRTDLGKTRRNILSQAAANTSSGLSLTLLLPSQGRWLRRRKNDGAVNRVPPDFYPRVWKLLCMSEGILVGKQFLPSNPTVYEKTAEELNFGLQVESLLDVIRDPAEREIAAECLMVINRLGERNPSISLQHRRVDLLAIIRDAVERHWDDWVASHASDIAGSSDPDVNADGQGSPQQKTQSLQPSTPNTPRRTSNTAPGNEVHPLLSRIGLVRAASQLSVDTGAGSESGSSHGGSVPVSAAPGAVNGQPLVLPQGDWSFQRHERLARRLFFDLPHDGKDGTTGYLGGSSGRLLFGGSIELDL
ncbi:glycosyl hydrolases family 15-domain-containing protein [Fimicolochytrium jonesii]|uniref:glycosyl hydrolases family 15-domain-containing protein n=1 Tax=Fimicolochytrium jonesii TaxID=1396493 RepID=UPI0022FE3B66|nr:glycosyl hydrolases family 15-domain-containing protein [Fimicolochytrium jonesii]KAI8822902.1 glycosyl hydrolases family 15-domain-containing protein [Fimicolochytrium jonesii]